jgi:hypothetical protein
VVVVVVTCTAPGGVAPAAAAADVLGGGVTPAVCASAGVGAALPCKTDEHNMHRPGVGKGLTHCNTATQHCSTAVK